MTLDSDGKWTISTQAVLGNQVTTLIVNTGVQELYAFVTLEVYGSSKFFFFKKRFLIFTFFQIIKELQLVLNFLLVPLLLEDSSLMSVLFQ